jgi:hypothetical protein
MVPTTRAAVFFDAEASVMNSRRAQNFKELSVEAAEQCSKNFVRSRFVRLPPIHQTPRRVFKFMAMKEEERSPFSATPRSIR